MTPKSACGLLEGVTRAFIFEAGKDVGIPVRDEILCPRDLETADEAFITSTTRELSPVVRVDDRVIGTGKPGPITAQAPGGVPAQGAGADRRRDESRLKLFSSADR